MYLQSLDIRCCRCSFWNQCICNLLFFELADTFKPACHVNCICILPFLGFKDTPFANFASTSHIFDNMKMLPSKITHPQLALSMLCGYFTSKFCIFNPRKSTIADTFHTISFAFYLLHNLSQYITYKKIDIRNSSEYEMGAGDT